MAPLTILQIMGPAGQITGPQPITLPAASQNQTIPAGTGVSLNSTITVPNDNATFPIENLGVELNITDLTDTLTAKLIAPNGSVITLFANSARPE